MKKGSSLLLVAFASVVAGGLSVSLLHAEATGKPPAFYVADFELTDPEGIKPYSAGVESTFAPFGGRFIVRGGPLVRLEGDAQSGDLSSSPSKAWRRLNPGTISPAYKELRPHRQRSGRTQAFIVEGATN